MKKIVVLVSLMAFGLQAQEKIKPDGDKTRNVDELVSVQNLISKGYSTNEALTIASDISNMKQRYEANGEAFDTALAGSSDKVKFKAAYEANIKEWNKTHDFKLSYSMSFGMTSFPEMLAKTKADVAAQEKIKPNYSMLASAITVKYSKAIILIQEQLIEGCASAQEKKTLEVALEQLEKGEQIAQINQKFILAVRFRDFDMLKAFLKDGANIDARASAGETALIFASANEGAFEIAKYLVENHANVNAQCSQGFTALMCASILGNTDIVKLLLDNGADTELKDKKGKTALWWAENQDRTEVVKLLKDSVNIVRKPKESITKKIVTP